MNLDTAHASSIPLEYAPARPPRRRWIWRGAWVISILVLCYSTWSWAPRAWQQAGILYWQRQCMNYTAPADQVVYEEEPAAIARLAAIPGYRKGLWIYRERGLPAPPPLQYAQRLSPPALTQLIASSPLPYRGVVPVFLHERRSPSGNRRLVYVTYFPASQTRISPPTWTIGVEIDPVVLIPAGLTTQAIEAPRTLGSNMSNLPRVPPHVRIFAGQPDPNDPSHFTIRYQMWGQEDVLDGWLGDDDRITLKPRKPPPPPTIARP